MPEVSISEDKLYAFFEQSKDNHELLRLCTGYLTSWHTREMLAHTLKGQEDEILKNITQDIFEDPNKLYTHFEGLLTLKGITYEGAVHLCDWSRGSPDKPMPEGGYVLAKLMAQTEAWKALRLKKGCEKFPFTEMWRFFIDGKHEKFGPYIYENEPFYMLSSLRGFKKILESKAEFNKEAYQNIADVLSHNPPVMKDARFLKNFHKTAEDLKCNYDNFFFSHEMINKGQSYDGSDWKSDSVGKADLAQRTHIYEETMAHLTSQHGAGNGRGGRNYWKPNEYTEQEYWIANATGFTYSAQGSISAITHTTSDIIASRIFLGLEQVLKNAHTPGERLIGYIWASRELEITHQLEDGNGRTSIAACIKWILEDKELPPYIPEDPNIFDQQGPEQLMRDIFSGMCRLCSLTGNDPAKLIDVEALIDQAGVRGQSWDVIHNRAKLPDDIISRLVAADKASLNMEFAA